MTREEAIEFIAQSVKSDVDMAKVADAIKALKQEPIKNHLGVDCVSREQALVAIRNLYPGMPRVDFNGSLRKWVDKYKPYIECEDAIEELPSVTSQEPKWIPVSERLPTKEEYIANNGLFIVTDGNRTCAEYFDVYNSKKFFGEPTMNGFRVDRCVIAWMPLPEPYKGESEVEE